MPHRLPQINELIRQQLDSLLLTEIDFPPGCLVTVTLVETTKDLRQATIFVSILPFALTAQVMKQLQRNLGHLQHLLYKQLSFKPLPRLRFVVDQTEEKAAEVENLINAHQQD